MKSSTLFSTATGTPEALVIPSRFCGPPGSANGGYACGRIAGYTGGSATVTLRQPPPLEAPMAVEREGESALRVRHGSTLIAEAASSPGRLALEIPGPVSPAEAQAAAGTARYYADPVFPSCFVCGMRRAPGDGLRIFPGPVAGRPVWAAPWTPDPSVVNSGGRVRPEVVWAALDCPSGIAAAEAAGMVGDTPILLGRMTARIAALPAAGEQCRVVAWAGERDGRKLRACSALLGPGGDLLAGASAVWLTVPRPVRAQAADGVS